jgi:YD repeat-containing protein
MVWTDECVLPLAASGVYPKTRVWGSKQENMHCFSATAPLKIELRWGCEESSEKTAAGSGVSFKYDPFGRRIQKSFTTGANPPTTTTTNYLFDRSNLIEEVDPNGNVLARYSQGLFVAASDVSAGIRSATHSEPCLMKPGLR